MSSTVSEAVSKLSGKYLTFNLCKEEYGLEILKVREIIGLMEITEVPRTPDYVRGVINLRGKIIPVMDLRVKFGMEAAEDTEETCIIVVDVIQDEGAIQMGILVDSVAEVLDIEADQIEPPPRLGGVQADFILGMGKIGQKVVLLLHVDKVLTSTELTLVAGTADVSGAAEKTTKKPAAAPAPETSEAAKDSDNSQATGGSEEADENDK